MTNRGRSGMNFVETLEYRRFVEFCEACCRYQYIGLCYGPSGVGKTLSSRRYTRWDDVETANWRRYPDGSLRELRSLHTVLYTPAVINTPRLIEHDLATWLRGAITSKGLRSNHCVAKRKVNLRQFASGTKRRCRMRLRPMIGLKRYRNSDRRMPRSAIGTLLRKRSLAIRQS
jgi:hypothetical protein